MGSRRISGRPSAFLIFSSDLDRPEVGDGCRHEDVVGAGCQVADGGGHLGSRFDGDHLDRRSVGCMPGRRRHAEHLGATGCRLGGEGVALLARRAVADVADGTDRLTGTAGGHQDGPTLEVASATGKRPLDGLDDDHGFGESPGSDVATGEAPLVRTDDLDATGRQHLDVLLHRRLLPHLGVHGGADDHRRPGGEERGGQEVARAA